MVTPKGPLPLPLRLLAAVALTAIIGPITLAVDTARPNLPRAQAAGIVVNTLADNTTPDGQCSLREAMINANANGATHGDCAAGAGADAISFSLGGTITLAAALPAIADASGLIIDGGVLSVTVSGGNALRPFQLNLGASAELRNLTVTNGAGSHGGAISSLGTLTITNSTINGNTATNTGGGIYQILGWLTVVNSTISGNTAGGGGGGIQCICTLTVTNSTISGNTAGGDGGGILANGSGTVKNTIVAGNTASVAGPECLAALTGVGANLVQNTSGCSITGGTLLTSNPLLGPLAENGGPTRTHALLPSSPALDVGDAAICAVAPVSDKDQRGVARPQGAGCDLGAFELEATPSVIGGRNLRIGAPGPAITLTWDPGNVQADYLVARAELIPAGPTTFSAPLSASATSYTDGSPPGSSLLCYQVIARDGVGTTLGLSDFDCGYTGFAGGTVVPGNFTLGLNQTNTASLTWTAPAGGPVDGYALYKLPFDGSPITFEALGAGATDSVQSMGATHYCYTLVAFRGIAFGNTNLVCGIQGFSSGRTLGEPRTIGSPALLNRSAIPSEPAR